MKLFRALGLREQIAKGLDAFGFSSPTKIQAAAVPRLLKEPERNFVIAGATGTGKTLAYLSAAVECMKRKEDTFGGSYRITMPGRPRVVVLVPTRELGMQTLSVARELSREAKFRTAALLGHVPQRLINRTLKEPMDVLVATPGTLIQCGKHNLKVSFNYVNEVVLDEADFLLLGKGFPETMLGLLQALKTKPRRFTYVAATPSEEMLRKLKREHNDNLTVLRGEKLHIAHNNRVFVEFVQIAQNAQRSTELRKALRKRKRTMIFCNTSKAVEYVSRCVEEMGYSSVALYGGQSRKHRVANWNSFKQGHVDCLVCTDIGSRGLDDQGVELVFMYDIPTEAADYIHRAGRLRGEGQITALVHKYVLNIGRSLFLAHVDAESMENFEVLDHSHTQKRLLRVPPSRGVFRRAVEASEDDVAQHEMLLLKKREDYKAEAREVKKLSNRARVRAQKENENSGELSAPRAYTAYPLRPAARTTLRRGWLQR
mmetsp:Transcript_5665/g.16845  ORF Transcript_5665/g.16845 Transcript_5665/m.16845 type:complete len:485 (+) Transcript_5665:337-1791(+)|eukprot:CAMPEP_0198726586 /NCGR_PEP_ID=MMETSP1475-20131203/3597_1 /TAXON_ID= ORGANISM="Unidentified sp., Strain CCMP1999" /NCGR_SAMPLE_ID=MMETSP1475 /ASSEMBLY_ACC=CAM_ASM_001111 /LENGTH=484 /DNA_ID=CAMNT_0044488527 /DNA_START=347 /DNA_END=1801 /DNA_ORIENTATION=+